MIYLIEDLSITPWQMEALNYYKKNTMSVEIIKDDSLQKINFRVKNKVSITVLWLVISYCNLVIAGLHPTRQNYG